MGVGVEVAQEILVCALKEVEFYFLLAAFHWQECRYDGSASAATSEHVMETAGCRWKH